MTLRALNTPSQHASGLRRGPLCSTGSKTVVFIVLLLSVAAGCSSNKTQSISEGYAQAVTDLTNGLALHVDDASSRDSAMTALQQADTLIRQAVERRDGAAKTFSETNADFDATREELGAIVSANQSANSSDVEALIELIATFQSALTSEELVGLYPERAEFARKR